MARTYSAFLPQAQIPNLDALQSAIHSLKFKLDLDESYSPLSFSGYLPCTLDDEDAGLSIRFNQSMDAGDQVITITLQWGGDPREQVSATMLAAALAHSFGAVVNDTHGQTTSAERLIAEARQQFSNLD